MGNARRIMYLLEMTAFTKIEIGSKISTKLWLMSRLFLIRISQNNSTIVLPFYDRNIFQRSQL